MFPERPKNNKFWFRAATTLLLRLALKPHPLVFLYNIFILGYQLLLKLAALRNAKARAWVEGRRNLFRKLDADLSKNKAPVIWVHSASTGEFEQAKPVIEALQAQYPKYKILASFFSPSGYEAAAGYPSIHYRYYLPADTAANARRFVHITKPVLVIFSKYDFWHHHLKAINKKAIPLILISSIFRKNQSFFRFYGRFHRAMLRRFTHIFVQDSASVELLQRIGIHKCSISGDTRFDRVIGIAVKNKAPDITVSRIAQLLVKQRPLIVAGSTWPGDESLIAAVQKSFAGLCWLIVPHEINHAHIAQLMQRFPDAVLLSRFKEAFGHDLNEHHGSEINHPPVSGADPLAEKFRTANVFIIDTMGLLSRLYSIATITYVGGGFTKDGIHNTLEAAVWGKPVIIGPNYKKYKEAKELIEAGGGFSIAAAAQLEQQIDHLINSEAALLAASNAAKLYVQNNAGATRHIMQYIQEKRLLTN